MGYADTLPFAFFELGNIHTTGEQEITTVAANYDFGVIGIPAFITARVRHAYLDVYFPSVRNSGAGVNWNVGSYVKIRKFLTGAYTNACYISDESLYLGAGEREDKGRFSGSLYDVRTIIEASVGTTIQVQWEGMTAHANSLFFRDAYCILRVLT